VRITAAAEGDLARLFDFLLERAETPEDLSQAQQVLDSLRVAIASHLVASPWSYRKAGDGRRSTRRELVVPADAAGYVALYEIESPSSVVVLAVRHQLEDDYH
jgi:plasmid stabilization system protein ParE